MLVCSLGVLLALASLNFAQIVSNLTISSMFNSSTAASSFVNNTASVSGSATLSFTSTGTLSAQFLLNHFFANILACLGKKKNLRRQ
ncbi:uncharacterized protein BDR25DRAFT_9418 [Lindgomyces ingoldianus]|uniref:Uncharacterized protein n=1 Tax=Lindgomyces ingoldianus TaxID=673940 RepID=A0ACB6RG34_9PLEO|nr:uncharacterized protein BDR25DRAFT_9418 [Lindgomyces ingoldianus]KAF2478278.1 hypothetical protein BDR25DRAFT_9418 [Lindgomyces ingoldianus]